MGKINLISDDVFFLHGMANYNFYSPVTSNQISCDNYVECLSSLLETKCDELYIVYFTNVNYINFMLEVLSIKNKRLIIFIDSDVIGDYVCVNNWILLPTKICLSRFDVIIANAKKMKSTLLTLQEKQLISCLLTGTTRKEVCIELGLSLKLVYRIYSNAIKKARLERNNSLNVLQNIRFFL